MNHIIVFVNMLILTVGGTVVYQGVQTYRTYRFPAVRSFVIYVALVNTVMFFTLIAQYLLRNVASLSVDWMYTLVAVLLASVAFTLAAIEIWMYTSTVWHLSGKARAPRWFVYGFGLVCTTWLAAFITGSYRYFQFADKRFLLTVHTWINYSLIAFFIFIPLLLILKSQNIQPERQARMLRTAGFILLSLSGLDIFGIFLLSPWNILIMMLNSLAFDVLLLLTFGAFVKAFYGPVVMESAAPQFDLDKLCEEFHFSARERDIILMLLKGKSNKEMEKEMFISSHTVKNHIYHIFQKAGIKSRGQLVSMIVQNSSNGSGRHESVR